MAAPIAGEDIMRERGLAPGPEVGRIKDRLAELIKRGVVQAPDANACAA